MEKWLLKRPSSAQSGCRERPLYKSKWFTHCKPRSKTGFPIDFPKVVSLKNYTYYIYMPVYVIYTCLSVCLVIYWERDNGRKRERKRGRPELGGGISKQPTSMSQVDFHKSTGLILSLAPACKVGTVHKLDSGLPSPRSHHRAPFATVLLLDGPPPCSPWARWFWHKPLLCLPLAGRENFLLLSWEFEEGCFFHCDLISLVEMMNA